MSIITQYVGLDVHKESISLAVAKEGRSKPEFKWKLPSDGAKLLRKLKRLGPLGSLHCAYEAGPTGYWLYRYLTDHGVRCDVIAPTLIPRMSGQRVKTDRIDACSLATHLRAGNLTEILVPTEHMEAMRTLTRARSATKGDSTRTKHRLSKFMLRHNRTYTGYTWTQKHLDWLRDQRFEEPSEEIAKREYLLSVQQANERVDRLAAAIERLSAESPMRPLILALQAMKGISLITSVGFAYELIELKRFPSAPQLMSFCGLVPSEHSSGESRRQGGITKTGNTHVRKLLTEMAWNCRFRPQISAALRRRQKGVSPEVINIAWKAQERLHHKYMTMLARGKDKKCIIGALSREILGFIWAIGQVENLLAD